MSKNNPQPNNKKTGIVAKIAIFFAKFLGILALLILLGITLADLREPFSDIRELVLRHDKDVALVDIPPCQLDPKIRRCARFHFEFAHPPDFKACSPEPMFDPPSCRRCVLAAQCSRVSAH